MAGSDDDDSKTEPATQRRIEDALKDGNVPVSREVANAAVFVSLGAGLTAVAAFAAPRLTTLLGFYIGHSGEIALVNGGDAAAAVQVMLLETVLAIFPLFLLFIVPGLVSSIGQARPRFVPNRLMPNVSRLAIGAGFKRLFKTNSAWELVRSLAKMAIIAVVLDIACFGRLDDFLQLGLVPADRLGWELTRRLSELFMLSGALIAIVAGVDVLWVRHKWAADLKMSREEIKEEHKQSEGDPRVRARIRSVARQQARKRMMAAVPKATLVIANPTHYAVAIRYVQGEMEAPIVLAKGVDHLALRIRAAAEQHRIPVIENKQLARALFDAAVTERPIPADFYKAVAEVILFIWNRQQQRNPAIATPTLPGAAVEVRNASPR